METKFYNADECMKKCDEHLALGIAKLENGDQEGYRNLCKISDVWYERAMAGGYLAPQCMIS